MCAHSSTAVQKSTLPCSSSRNPSACQAVPVGAVAAQHEPGVDVRLVRAQVAVQVLGVVLRRAVAVEEQPGVREPRPRCAGARACPDEQVFAPLPQQLGVLADAVPDVPGERAQALDASGRLARARRSGFAVRAQGQLVAVHRDRERQAGFGGRQPRDPFRQQHRAEVVEGAVLRVRRRDGDAVERQHLGGRPRDEVAHPFQALFGVAGPAQRERGRRAAQTLREDGQQLGARLVHVEAQDHVRVEQRDDPPHQVQEARRHLGRQRGRRRVVARVVAEVEQQVVEDDVLRPHRDLAAIAAYRVEQPQVPDLGQHRVLRVLGPARLHERAAVRAPAIVVFRARQHRDRRPVVRGEVAGDEEGVLEVGPDVVVEAQAEFLDAPAAQERRRRLHVDPARVVDEVDHAGAVVELERERMRVGHRAGGVVQDQQPGGHELHPRRVRRVEEVRDHLEVVGVEHVVGVAEVDPLRRGEGQTGVARRGQATVGLGEDRRVRRVLRAPGADQVARAVRRAVVDEDQFEPVERQRLAGQRVQERRQVRGDVVRRHDDRDLGCRHEAL